MTKTRRTLSDFGLDGGRVLEEIIAECNAHGNENEGKESNHD
jgi:hypothetical protein